MSGFPSLELGTPGRAASCPDQYTTAATLYCGGATRLRVQTSKAYVYLQFGTGVAAPVWGPEEPISPVVGTIPRSFDAVRVRNFITGKPAEVLLTAYP